MLIIGLTGSIGMGKSTTADFFRKAGIPVHDADQAVHELYDGKAVPLIEKAFPVLEYSQIIKYNKINRDRLFSLIIGDADAIKRLEAIIHPLVREHRNQFVEKIKNSKIVVFDVPLLFEIGMNKECDVIITVSAPFEVQKARVLARQGMNEARFKSIVAKQLPDNIKRRQSHFIIDTAHGYESARRQVNDILRCLAQITKSLNLE